MKEDKKREMERTEKKEKMIANYDLQIADEKKKLEAILRRLLLLPLVLLRIV